MKVFYISPVNQKTPMLFDTFIGMDGVDNCGNSDAIFFDLHSRKYEYNQEALQSVINDENKPVVIFDFYDYGIYKNEESEWLGKNNWQPLKRIETQWAVFIKNILLQDRKIIWFVRKYDKMEDYTNQNVYPIELIMYPDHVFNKVDSIELFNRPNDIFFIGNSSPTRRNIVKALNDTDLKIDIAIVEERVDHIHWLYRANKSKMFLECCGSGFGSERPYQLIYISPMLRVKNNQLILHNFRDGLECLDISEFPTKQEIQNLKEILTDKDKLHEMYVKGMERMSKYFCADYRSNYILRILKQEYIC